MDIDYNINNKDMIVNNKYRLNITWDGFLMVKSLSHQTTKLDDFVKNHFPVKKVVSHLIASHQINGEQIREVREVLTHQRKVVYCGDNMRLIPLR